MAVVLMAGWKVCHNWFTYGCVHVNYMGVSIHHNIIILKLPSEPSPALSEFLTATFASEL